MSAWIGRRHTQSCAVCECSAYETTHGIPSMLHHIADRIYEVKKAHERDGKLSDDELRLLDSHVTYLHTIAEGKEPSGLKVDMRGFRA